MSKKNILFVSYFYPPANGVGVPAIKRISRFIKYLKIGKSFVLTVKPQYYPEYIDLSDNENSGFNNETVYRASAVSFFGMLLRIKNILSGVILKKEIVLSNTVAASPEKKNTNYPSKIQQLKDVIYYLFSYPDFARSWVVSATIKGLVAIKKEKIDIIVATGMPWSSLLVGYLLKKITGKKLVVDFRDPWVDNPYISKGVMEKYMDVKCEGIVVRNADLVIANTDALMLQMQAQYPGSISKIISLSNGFDKDDFKDISEINLPKDKLNIVHAGFLYLKRDPIDLLKAFEIVKSTHPEQSSYVQFYQIGNINLDYDLNAFCRKNDLAGNVIIKEHMEHKLCLGYLRSADVLLLIQPGTKTQIPSKIYEYIYLERPILAITEKTGALGELIEKYDFGYVFEPDEHVKIARFLSVLIDKKRSWQSIRTNYVNKEFFDAEIITRRFHEYLTRL